MDFSRRLREDKVTELTFLKLGDFLMATSESSVFDLNPDEKLQLVEDLWDDLSSKPEEVPVHEWQVKELERRKANLMKNPAPSRSWEEIKKRVRQRNGG